MSAARPVYKNAYLMITKRVRNRLFLLHPHKNTSKIILYIVAVVARKYRIKIHSLMVMSNHWHLTVTDPEGDVCNFTRDCHSTIARALNAEYGDFESLWASGQTSHVACEEPSDLVDKIVYSMANPVKAHLVTHGKNWPGIRKAWPAKPVQVERMGKFFRNADDEKWPETAVLKFARPPGYEELDDDQFAAMLDEAVETREKEHRQDARRRGKRFLGRRNVLRQSRYDSPKSREEKFKISPRVACKDKWRRIERLARNEAWLEAYNLALEKWCEGDRTVEFPHGTYKMRVLHEARCAAGPPS